MLLLPSQLGSTAPGALATQVVSDPSHVVSLANSLTAEEQTFKHLPGFLWAGKEQCTQKCLMPSLC